MGRFWGVVAFLMGAFFVVIIGCGGTRVRASNGIVAVAPSAINFGQVNLGRLATQSIDVQNRGGIALRLISIRQSSGGGVFTNDAPASGIALPSGVSTKLPFHFMPLQMGATTATIELTFDNDKTPMILVLQGEGVLGKSELSAPSLDFGNVVLGQSVTKTITLTNNGGVASTVNVAPPNGPDAPAFQTVGSGPAELNARDGRLTITVKFAPQRLGLAQSELTIALCSVCQPVSVPLTGSGIAAVLEATPLQLDFGAVAVGLSATRTFTLHNAGSQPLSVSSLSIADASFAIQNSPLPIALPSGAQTMVTVQFTARRIGQFRALCYISNTTGIDAAVTLSAQGGGPVIRVQPSALDFGIIALGASAQRQIVIANTGFAGGRPAPLTISAIKVAQGPEFHVDARNLPVTLAIGAQATFSVSYDPLTAQTAQGMLEIDSNDGAHPAAQVALTGQGRALAPCQNVVAPTPLDFGSVQVGSTAVLAFAIDNRGTDDCVVNNLALSASTPPSFSLPGGSVIQAVLHPSERLLTRVAFTPSNVSDVLGSVEFAISDPAHPSGTVGLIAHGVQRCLTVTPATLDFGTLGLMCGFAVKNIAINNTCSQAVSVSSAVIGAGTSSAFSLVQPFAPLTLPPAQNTSIAVRYAPLSTGPDAAPLWLNTDVATAPFLVGLTGNASASGRVLDAFDQAPGQVDILWVMDNSGSLTEETTALAPALHGFWQALTASGVDFHLAVTTTGMTPYAGGWTQCPGGAEGGEAGRFFPVDGSSPRIITNATPNGEQVLRNNLNVGMCHWDERFFEPLIAALTSPLVDSVKAPGTPFPADGNAGFLRDDAKLALMVLTDANDDDDVPNPVAVAPYFQQILALKKGRTDRLTFGGLAALTRCTSSESVGTRYQDFFSMVNNGRLEDSCDLAHYSDMLVRIGQALLVPRTVFPLTQTPGATGQITVTVNGVAVDPAAYTYDPAQNAVTFRVDSAPPYGSHVEISYDPGC